MEMTQEYFDAVEGYCPRLGHSLTFKYCRMENGTLPCRKIRDCWFEKIAIESYLETFCAPENLERLEEAPKPKMLSIFEIMQNVQKRQESESE